MKPLRVDYFSESDEQGGAATLAMDMDEVEALEFFGEGDPIGLDLQRLADSDFFNTFSDDFDDSDIN